MRAPVKQGGSWQTGGNANALLDLKSPPSILPLSSMPPTSLQVLPDGHSRRVMAFREGW